MERARIENQARASKVISLFLQFGFIALSFLAIEARAEDRLFTQLGLPGVLYSSVAWGDYDKDGDLDILLTGSTESGPAISSVPAISKVYRNDGNGVFTDINAGLIGVSYGSVAWGDYDKDGDLDILLTGSTESGGISKVYRNDGNGVFTEINAGLTGVYDGSVAWGDYDGDGDLDILLTGISNLGRVSKIYRNDGNGVFTDINAGLAGVMYSSVAWGDYDKDGDLDVLLTGDTGSGQISKIYRNDGNGVFTDINANLTGVQSSSVACGDYDGDGDLDILLTGISSSGRISKVYRNNGNGTFTNAGVDLPGVTRGSIAWGDYDGDGDLDILLTGESISGRISKIYRNDGNGLFTDINAALIGVTRGSVAWGDYDNDGDLDILLTGELNSKVYRNDGNGVFTQLGLPGVNLGSVAWGDYDKDGDLDILLTGSTESGGIFTVYRNDGNGVFTDINAGLTGVGGRSVAWGDYDGDGDLDILLTGYSSTGPISKIYRNDGNGLFTDINAGLTGVFNSSVAWGDYDGDSDLDILITGCTQDESDCSGPISKVYRNDGNGVFTEINAGLPGVRYSSVAWGDYDKDGDLDILLTGSTESGGISKVYRNDGNGVFTDINVGLTVVAYGSVAWGDYDGDGDLDILLTGVSSAGPISKIYRNNGNGTFTNIGADLVGISEDSVAWGDYDGDGDLDILLTGYTSSGAGISKIYRNDGNGVFTDINAGLTGVFNSSVAWGDYDGDGDLDILLTGYPGSGQIAKIYRNDLTYTLSGTIASTQGPISGVTVSNGDFGTTTTDASGNYSFTKIPQGSYYRITAQKTAYSFTPSILTGQVAGNVTGLDFTGTVATYTISGTITAAGLALSGVIVTGSGTLGSQTTDGSGHYSFTGVPYGTSYTLTPSKDSYTFNPTTASGTLTGNATENFMAQAYTVSGTVTINGEPLSGVTISSNQLGTQITDESGHYSFTGITGVYVYFLAPSKTGYTFNPSVASALLTSDKTHDFTATQNPYTISGTVTVGGSPLSGVTVTGSGTLGGQITDGSGNYSFTGVPHGTSYTLTPSKASYSFSPTTASGTLTGPATHDFVATLITYSVTGQVTLNDAPLSGVTISSAELGTQTTDASGNYQFTNVVEGSNYSLAPSKAGYSFNPSYIANTLNSNAVHNFSVSRVAVQGTITTSGKPLSGVIITCGGVTPVITNGLGAYILNVPVGLSCTLTPEKTGYRFTPISLLVPATAPVQQDFGAALLDSDNDGLSDLEELERGTNPNKADTDGDGLSDGEEVRRGSNPLVADSDNDGITDGQEVSDGTNPNDKGSSLPVLQTTLCAEWNGFLGMYNILEHVNLSGGELGITTSLYDIKGNKQDAKDFKLKKGRQFDVLVHDMKGRNPNSYGLVCSNYSGNAGDLDGRMVYYRYNNGKGKTEFAFAMPFLNPRSGEQIMPFNTYQPSLDTKDANNLVANWIQISNISDKMQKGTLYFHGFEGSELHAFPITLPAHARYDAPGHYFGGSVVGIVRWVPDDAEAEFQVRNVRYLYDNAVGADSFDTAFQLEGAIGTGELITAPLDTRGASSIVEIANTTDNEIRVAVKVYEAHGGDPLYNKTIKLAKYASYHLITDQILGGKEGIVMLDGNAPNSVIATVMQYGRTPTLGIQYMYGIQAKSPLGSVLKSSYNTFLNQGCSLLLVNPGNSATKATITLVRYDGTSPVAPYEVTIPAHGLWNEDICSKDNKDVYGVATVQPATANSLYGTVVRLGEKDQYRFPTPVRQ